MKFSAFTKFALAASLAVAPAALFAQSATPVDRQTINQRKADQQARIAQGDRSGQLTRGENRRLETQEHASTAKSAACARRTTDI